MIIIIHAMGSHARPTSIEKQCIELRLRELIAAEANNDQWICRGCFGIYRLGHSCPKIACIGMGMEGKYWCEVKVVNNYSPSSP